MVNTSLPGFTLGKYEIERPIIQGGMGVRISAGRLAGAVAAAGGVGVLASVALGVSYTEFKGRQYFESNRNALAEEIAVARKAAPNGVIGVNCMVAITDYEDMVRISAKSGADVIISGAGLPLKLPEYTADHPEVALVPIVSSVKAARIIIRKWGKQYGRLPDGLVCETPNSAGGHLGTRNDDVFSPEFALEKVIPELAEFVEKDVQADIPIIAAGGIWDRADVERMMSLGASGVQMSTRFIGTPECDAAPEFKQALIDATAEDVVVFESPVGLPGRAIRNEFLTRYLEGETFSEPCAVNCLKRCRCRETKDAFCIVKALHRAQMGDIVGGLLFTGSNVDKLTGIVPVADIMEDLAGPRPA